MLCVARTFLLRLPSVAVRLGVGSRRKKHAAGRPTAFPRAKVVLFVPQTLLLSCFFFFFPQKGALLCPGGPE